MIRLNVEQEALDRGIGLDKIVKDIIFYQIFYRNAIGKDIKLKALQKEMYDNKLNRPFIFKKVKLDVQYSLVKPLCDTATSTFLGRVPDIVTSIKGKENARISKFTLLQKHNGFEEEIYDTGLQASITGSGFLCLYNEIGDNFPKYRSLDPLYTNVVYDCSVAMKRLFAYTIRYEASDNGDGTNGKYVVLIYTKEKIFAFETGNISLVEKESFAVYPLNLFLINGTQYTNETYHGFKDIPIIEFWNNKDCISDCKAVLPQIALYSALQNNRFQNVDDIMNYLLFIKNARLGDEKEAQIALNLIKNHRVLPLEGEDVDAKFLSNPLNQTDIQKLADDYKNSIHYISGIPDFTSVEFTQNASDVIIKAKTKPLLDLCQTKEKWFNKGYMQVLDLTLDFVGRYDKQLFEKIKFDLDSVDLVYTHTLPSNETDAVNRIVNLANVGCLDPMVALQWLPSIPNVAEYIKGMKEFNEYVDIRKKNNNNINNGLNETNLERQNENPKTRDNQDNIVNAIKGDSQDLSYNKVE